LRVTPGAANPSIGILPGPNIRDLAVANTFRAFRIRTVQSPVGAGKAAVLPYRPSDQDGQTIGSCAPDGFSECSLLYILNGDANALLRSVQNIRMYSLSLLHFVSMDLRNPNLQRGVQ
jgi:hypothetical protein